MEKNNSKKILIALSIPFSFLFTNFLIILHSQIILRIPIEWKHFILPSVVGLLYSVILIFFRVFYKKTFKEKKNDEMNIFTIMAVHDLKCSLSGICSLVELIKENKKKKDSDDELIKMIQSTAKDTLKKIEDILNMIKHQKNNIKKKEKVNNPYNDINKYIDIFKKRAKHSGILITRKIDKDLPSAKYNGSLLKDILSNLIGNAIKYSNPGSRITISTKIIDNVFIKINVEDNGQGLTQDDVKKAFNQFQKLSAKPTNEEKSTGLGLWITKKLTNKMGGDVDVFSLGLKQGACFSFTLPIIKEKKKLK